MEDKNELSKPETHTGKSTGPIRASAGQPNDGERTHAGLHMLSGSAYITVAEIFMLVSRFATAVFLARYLGPTRFGFFMLAVTLVVWLQWTMAAAFSNATIKYVSESTDWQPVGAMVIRLNMMVSLFICIALLLSARPLAILFDEILLVDYLRLFALEIPLFGLSRAQSNILIGRGLYKVTALVSAVHSMARWLLIMALVAGGLSVKGAIIGSVSASLIEVIVGKHFVGISYFRRARLSIPHFWGFVGPLFLSNMSLRIFRLDLFALKALGATAAQAGFYSAARNLSLPTTVIAKAVIPTMLSTTSRLLSHGERSEAREIIIVIMRLLCWFFPFTVMVSAMASELVVFIFGPDFRSAGGLFSLLIFSALAFVTINIVKAKLIAIGRPMLTLLLTSPLIPFGLFGHLFMVPRFGAIGAAFVTTAGACIMALISMVVIIRVWKVTTPVKTMMHSLICSILALTVTMLWSATGYTVVLKMLTVSALILLCFGLLKEFTNDEINAVLIFFKSRLGAG